MTKRRIDGTDYTLTYDAENRLTGVVSAGKIVSTSSFKYDGDGNRVQATLGITTTAYVGANFEWAADGSNTTMKKYYYAAGQRIAMREGTGAPQFMLTDHLGSTSVTVSTAGVRTHEMKYMPWGEDLWSYNDPPNSPLPTSAKYTGQRQDRRAGLGRVVLLRSASLRHFARQVQSTGYGDSAVPGGAGVGQVCRDEQQPGQV